MKEKPSIWAAWIAGNYSADSSCASGSSITSLQRSTTSPQSSAAAYKVTLPVPLACIMLPLQCQMTGALSAMCFSVLSLVRFWNPSQPGKEQRAFDFWIRIQNATVYHITRRVKRSNWHNEKVPLGTKLEHHWCPGTLPCSTIGKLKAITL